MAFTYSKKLLKKGQTQGNQVEEALRRQQSLRAEAERAGAVIAPVLPSKKVDVKKPVVLPKGELDESKVRLTPQQQQEIQQKNIATPLGAFYYGATQAVGELPSLLGSKFAPRKQEDIKLEQIARQQPSILPKLKFDVSRGYGAPNIQETKPITPFQMGQVASVAATPQVLMPVEKAIEKTVIGAFKYGGKAIASIASKVASKTPLNASELKILKDSPNIVKELGLPEGTTAQDFIKQQEQIAREVASDKYLTGLEKQYPVQQPKVTKQLELPKQKVVAESTGIKPIKEKGVTIVETPKLGTEKVANVLVELPKKTTPPVFEKLAKGYQEVVSTSLPLERMGKVVPKVAQQASLGRKATGTVDYVINNKMVDNTGNEVGNSLFDVFRNVPEQEKSDLYEYALHKHNLSRYEQGKPVFGETVDQAVSQSKLAEIESRIPDIAEKSKAMVDYSNNLMEHWALKSGLVNEETLQTLRNMYPDYVPTYRAKDADKAIVGGSKGNVSNVIKKAKGGSSDILPLDQQLAAMTNRVIRSSRKNEMYNAIQDAFDANPSVIERFFKPIAKEKQLVDEGLEGIVDTFEEPIKKVGDTYELSYFRNGEKVKAQISKDLYDAIKPMTDENALVDFVKKYATNPFKSLVTGYNPIFIVKNVMRDLPTAFIYSKDGLGWAKNVVPALKEIMSDGKYWKEYQALGGTRSGIFSYEKGVTTPFKGKTEPLLQKGAKGVLNKIETVNNVTETLPRFAEYLNTVKKGGNTYDSRIEGMLRASEITTDFTRSGKTGKMIDAFVPYLNPSIQGIDKTIRQFATRPIQTAAKGSAVITVPTLILDSINKNNRDYKEIQEREKNQNYLIPDGEGNFLRIPKSRETGVVFSSLFEWIARRSRGEDVKPKDIWNAVKENFTPVNMFENAIVTPALKAWDQIKEPTKEVTNYAGIPIVPTVLKKLEPKEQYDNYTSEVGKQIGQMLDISPKVVDYLIRSYTGIVGQSLLPKTSATQRGVVEAAFKTDPVFKSKLTANLYDSLEEKKRKVDTLEERDKPVDTKLQSDVKVLTRYNKEISGLRKEQRSVDAMKELAEEEKKKRIKDLQIRMNDLARQALEATK